MNRHSKTFEEKKAALEKIEKELRTAIDSDSQDFEKSLIKVLQVAAVVSSGVLIGYGIYRWTKKNSSDEGNEKNTDTSHSFIDKIVDKVTDVVAGLAVQNISKYIDNLKQDLEKEIKR